MVNLAEPELNRQPGRKQKTSSVLWEFGKQLIRTTQHLQGTPIPGWFISRPSHFRWALYFTLVNNSPNSTTSITGEFLLLVGRKVMLGSENDGVHLRNTNEKDFTSEAWWIRSYLTESAPRLEAKVESGFFAMKSKKNKKPHLLISRVPTKGQSWEHRCVI